MDSHKCIGFLGADWWGSDPRAMADEFRARGHLLFERHYESYLPTRWEGALLKGIRKILLPRITREYNEAVSQLSAVPGMDFLLVFKGMLLEPKTLEQFRQRHIPCYLVYPDVSFRDHGANIWACLPLYECVFTTKSFHMDDARLAQRARELRGIRHGYDPEVHRPVVATDGLRSTYACDVSFVGCWSPKKEQLLRVVVDRAPDAYLAIWGPGWERADRVVREKWKGRGAFGDELAAIYSLSRVNLGLLSEAGTGTASGDLTTARSWQIPASGGFLLHEDNEEIRSCFEPEKDVGLFRDAEELVSQIRYYLKEDTKREQLRQSGRDRCVSAPYTYKPAVDSILEYHRLCS